MKTSSPLLTQFNHRLMTETKPSLSPPQALQGQMKSSHQYLKHNLGWLLAAWRPLFNIISLQEILTDQKPKPSCFPKSCCASKHSLKSFPKGLIWIYINSNGEQTWSLLCFSCSETRSKADSHKPPAVILVVKDHFYLDQHFCFWDQSG